MKLSNFKKLPALIIKDIKEKDLLNQSAALSYYCALSLAPFIILALTIFSFLGAEVTDAFSKQITQTIGKDASEIILVIIKTAKEHKEERGISGVLSVFTLFISASAVFAQLKATIVSLFSEKTSCEVQLPEQSWKDFFKERLFSIGMMVTFIFISLVSLVLSSALPFILSTSEDWLWQSFNFLASFILYAFVFYLVFFYVSNKKANRKNSLIGGILAAFLFVIGRSLISLYLTKSAAGSSYGAAGSLIVLLIWVYYTSFAVFLSGLVTSNLEKLHT